MLRLGCISVCLALAGAPVWADAPRVQFDMPYTIACRDVSSTEFTAANPGQKLVELKLPVSALLVAGEERDVLQFLIRIDTPQGKINIVDYLPKTSHDSALAGPITIQNTKEQNASLGINFSGKYEIISAVGPSAGIGQKKSSCVKYDLLPPLETVAASGTLNRGGSVFFKLKSSPRNLLEGSRELALVVRVPTSWRCDYLRVRCEAEGIQRGMVSTFDETRRSGQREFLVAAYLEGDEEAQRSAETFARRDAERIGQAKSTNQSRGKNGSSWTWNVPGVEKVR